MFGGLEHTQRRPVARKGKQKSDYEMHMKGEEKEKKEEGGFNRLEARKRAEDRTSPEIEKAQLQEQREMDTEKPHIGKAMSTTSVDAEDRDEAEDADAVIQYLLIRSPSTPGYLPPLTGDTLPDTIPSIASPTVSASSTSISNLPEHTHSSPLGDDDPLLTPPPDDNTRPVDRLFAPSLSAAVIPVDQFFIPSPLPPPNRALPARNPMQASIVPAPHRRVFLSHVSVPPFPEGVSKNDYRFPPQARRSKKQATTRDNVSMSAKAKSDASAKSLLKLWPLKSHGKAPRAIKPTALTVQSLEDTLAASWNHNAALGALPSFEKDRSRQSAELKRHKGNFGSVRENADAGSSRLPIVNASRRSSMQQQYHLGGTEQEPRPKKWRVSAGQRPNAKDRKAELGLRREKASYQRLFGYARSEPDLDLVHLYFDVCQRIPQSIVAMNTRHIRKVLELDPANWKDSRRHWTFKQHSRDRNNQPWFRWPPAFSAPSGSSTSETDEELYSLGGTVLEWDWDEESMESDEEILPALAHRANMPRTETRDPIPQHNRKRKREQDSDPEPESDLESENKVIMIEHRKVSSDSQFSVRSIDRSVRQTNPSIPETVSPGASDTMKDIGVKPAQPSAKALGKRKADDLTLTIVDPVDGPFPITSSTTRQRSTKVPKSSTIHASMVAVPLHASTSTSLPTFDLSNAESSSIIAPYLSQQYAILSASGSPTNRHAIPGLRQSADENIFLTGLPDFQSEFMDANKAYDSQWSLNEDPLDDSDMQFTATIDPMLLDGGEQLQDINFLHLSQSPDFSPRPSLSPPRQTHSPTPSSSSSPSVFHTSSSSSGSSLRQTLAKEERSAEITLPQGGSSSEQTSVLTLSAIDVGEMHAAHSPESTGVSEFRALSGSEYAESDANVGTSRRMSSRKPVPSRKRQITPETSPTFDDEDYAAAKKPKKLPTAPRRPFCHVCRNRSKRLRMTCSCTKHFCNRCIINRFPEITFDDSGIDFMCPVCNDTCVCDLCTRKRGEEYISLRTERAAPRPAGRRHSPERRQFDSLPPGRSHLGGKTNLPPAISLHDLPLSSNLVTGPTMFWGTVYDLKGEKVATAFKLAADCAPETKTVVVRPVKYKPCSRRKRVFIGAVQSSWRFGSRPRVKDLKPYPRMSPQKKKCSPERLYVGKQWLLFVPTGSADTAGVLQQDREFSLTPLTPISSSPKSDSVAKVFSPNSLEDNDVQRAIFSALAAVNVSYN
ncbi:hypothetical protein BDQ12DRAFT_690672 [Crucibulum laeve]|uniref:RING-type domain-containing protein n=1 Tax=Crucibulum laeve TaxID=68775 RepID=A0A5C3LKV1_9AGAR|nr:hypothetical protein BDQ12DRAFT_690672 [Crucibulum laeve]